MSTDIQTLHGATSLTAYPNGEVQTCRLGEHNVVHTPYGDLVPRFSGPDERSKDLKSLSFYEGGAIRSISLEEQTEVATPIGPMPAELVTFHPDGSLDSVFPLNGQLGWSWTEDEERALAQPCTFRFSFGDITAKIIAVRFSAGGRMRSVTLWPGEVVSVSTPLGVFPARTGLSIHEDGRLESFEPAEPVSLPTPIGPVTAYDVNALEVDGEMNSVRFDPLGNLTHVTTSGDVIVHGADGRRLRVSSRTRLALAEDKPVKLPIRLSFAEGQVTVDNGREAGTFDIAGSKFLALPDIDVTGLCASSCDSCSLCG